MDSGETPTLFAATARISPPEGFKLGLTAYSHGWYDLPPFEGDRELRTLGRTLLLSDGTTAWTSLHERREEICIRSLAEHPLTAARRKEIGLQWRVMLRLDEDFRLFHAAARRSPRTRWIARAGTGRLLRAPTVFEDVVKMICTTNCTWGLTKSMVSALVRTFGKPFTAPAAGQSPDERFAFPTPQSIAAATETILRSRCSTGYRAPYILELARRVAEGNLDPEAWRNSDAETPALFDTIRSVKGVGPYAAGNILKLLGRYDYLGLDSWVRSRYYQLHHNGRKVKDRTIERAYAGYGEWRGLIFWLEMTRHWHAEKFGGTK